VQWYVVFSWDTVWFEAITTHFAAASVAGMAMDTPETAWSVTVSQATPSVRGNRVWNSLCTVEFLKRRWDWDSTRTHQARCSPWPLKIPLAALHRKKWSTHRSYQVMLVVTERKCWVEVSCVDRRGREQPSQSYSLHRNELGAHCRHAVREHRGTVVHIPIPPPREGLRDDQQRQLATRRLHNNTGVMWNAGHVGGCDVNG
jgi:hypothetical protein